MALIDCPDCGRRVSDAALACPDCARPIAGFVHHGVAAAKPERPVHREDAPSTPESPDLHPALKALEQQVKLTRKVTTPAPDATGGPKVCARCGQDVAADPFRAKRASGYLCMECLDADDERAFRLRQRMRTLRMALFAMLVIAGGTIGIVYAVSRSLPKKPTTVTTTR
jgi:hypothetical protein